MKRIFLLPAVLLLLSTASRAQEVDTIYRVNLPTYNLRDTRLWADWHDRYRYNQMRYYVTTVMPYVLEATQIFNQLNEELPGLRGQARRSYVRRQEALVRTRFEEKIEALNETQGVLLIKLVTRQTGLNLFQQIQDFKGTFAALKWQGWARLHGFNLNRKYHPEEEPDLEHIMNGLGYPLPAAYSLAGNP